ncbi:MAG TPA: hypothetical protein VJK52_05020, partial [Candidatus Nanoarchaeia archaeon]|nr:hypothetical protein [Candidatus Nanoarchaeia archaeon]
MDRDELLQQAFDRSAVLQLDTQRYRNFVEDFFALQLQSDLWVTGDITSRILMPSGSRTTARIFAQEPGIAAGLAEVQFFIEKNDLQVQLLLNDGERIKKNTALMEIHGDRRLILMLERTAVNALQRMSGIATVTHRLRQLVQVPIAATRKTLWGLIDKKAVAVGGGLTHRLGVEDAILIKSNHLDLLKKSGAADPVLAALETAWKRRTESTFIEVEVRDLAEAAAAAKIMDRLRSEDPDYPLLIMFDNFSVPHLRAA